MKNLKKITLLILLTIGNQFLIFLEKANAHQTRSIPGFVIDSTNNASTYLDFNKTALGTYNGTSFYLGAKSVPSAAKNYSITRADALSNGMNIVGITPEKIDVNIDEKTSEKQDNDLYGKQILNLVLYQNIYLMATYEQKADTDPESTSNILYMILNPKQNGNYTIKTDEALKDAAKADTKQIKALTSSDAYIFAAVSATDKTWQDETSAGENRGIAVVKTKLNARPNPTLKQRNVDDLASDDAEAVAKKVSVLPADTLICFSQPATADDKIGRAFIGADVDMCWSTSLKRLYVGLSEVKRDQNNKEGGCFSILIGRIDTDASDSKSKIYLSPILYDPKKDKFENNSMKHIIGFYYDKDHNSDIKISTKKILTLNTSTNKNYLIVNCNVIENMGQEYNQVFALPILGYANSDGKKIDTDKVGTLSKIENKIPTFDTYPTKVEEMPIYIKNDTDNSTKGILVGGTKADNIKQELKELTDMFVYGDSVYICLGDQNNTQNQGIFQSSAIFNENGIIIGWTPWQRIGVGINRILGGGIDSLSNFYALCGQDSDPTKANTIRITKWGTTEDSNLKTITEKTSDGYKVSWDKDQTHNLSTLISQIFPQDEGGVFQLINFDEYTPGFKQGDFSMMIAIGRSKVALIQTGKKDGGKFIPNTTFTINNNVFVFDLKDIAPLCFAEASRSPNANEGWLFIGGYGGVAVLSKADGSGWTSLANLTTADFPGATYSFKILNPSNGGDFKYVRKLTSLVSNSGTVKKLFIQTMNKLYTIDQTSGQFSTGNVIEKDITFNPTLTNPHFTDMLIIPNNDDPNSTTSTGFKFILGTTQGLFVGNNFDGSKINISSLSTSSNPALHLHYLSQTKGKNGTIGNLFATHANFLSNSGKVYRYAIDGSQGKLTDAIKPINIDNTNLFIDFHNFRGNFVTDGAFGFSLLTRGPSNDVLTYLYDITQNASETILPLDEFIDLNSTNWYVGVITRNTASGSWLIPGDWGIRVNE